MRKKKLISVIGLITVIVTFVLTGCGNSKNNDSANADKGKKQELDLSASTQLNTLDISQSTGFGQTGNVFESFFRLGKDGSVTPGLAKSSEVSKDGKTWTFNLRNAKWSNGDPITAHDFVYSWQRTVDPKTKAEYAYLFDGIKNASQINQGKLSPSKLGIQASNDHTVKVTLDKPIAYFKNLMTYPLFAPQNKKVVQQSGSKYGTDSKHMVYSGPFKVVNWNSTGDKWSFVKNNNYWDKKVVKLNNINYTVNSSPSTILDLYQTKKLSLAQLSTEQLKNYQNNNDLRSYPYSMTSYLKYNFQDHNQQNKKIINNPNIRKAISLAINRDSLSKNILGLKSQTSTGFVPHGLAKDPKTNYDYADQQKVSNTTNYNPKLAQELWKKGLKETGQKNIKLSILSSDDSPESSTVTQYLKGTLEPELKGLDLTIRSLPTKVSDQEGQKGNFDISLSSWGADFKDPITFLQIPQAGTAYNTGKYNNKEYNSLIDRASNQDANNTEQRWEDLVKAGQILNKDQGMTALYQDDTYYLQQPSVKGIIHNNAGPQWNYKYAYIK